MQAEGGELTVKWHVQNGQLRFSISDTGGGAANKGGGSDFCCLLYHQSRRKADGIGHKLFHCRIAWRPAVGDRSRRTRSHLSFHLAHPDDRTHPVKSIRDAMNEAGEERMKSTSLNFCRSGVRAVQYRGRPWKCRSHSIAVAHGISLHEPLASLHLNR